MALQRKSRFGFPPVGGSPSMATVRMVPLSHGMALNEPWPARLPGSAGSLVNFIPQDGVLAPRSRLSSLNTIRVPGHAIHGLAELPPAVVGASFLWYSCNSVHGILNSNGSVSRASFITAAGLGVAGIVSGTIWQYAHAYSDTSDRNMLIAVPANSYSTLLALYQNDASIPYYSYVTGAPEALSVGAFDNYIVAMNLREGGSALPTRVRWCKRGEPFNWTGEGSGFEDLLAMRGMGTAVKGDRDGRLLLFGDKEIWYAMSATYPAQFDFHPLETNTGCPYPLTIQDTDAGYMFLGSDMALRLLPHGGGVSQRVLPSLAPLFRSAEHGTQPVRSWAVFDPSLRMYHLFYEPKSGVAPAAFIAISVNVDTGEWGHMEYHGQVLQAGIALNEFQTRYARNDGLFFGDSNGTVYSTNSLLATDSGSTVTSTWRSTPIASELPGVYKQLTEVCIDYRSTSNSTITLKVSTDGGNTYESTGRVVSLPVAPVSGRVKSQMYLGGAFPAMEITSNSTGFELHRFDATLTLGGQP